MPEHYTKNTVEVSAWCSPCGQATMHRVDNGRRGPCLTCLAKLGEPKAKPGPPPAQQEDLFR